MRLGQCPKELTPAGRARIGAAWAAELSQLGLTPEETGNRELAQFGVYLEKIGVSKSNQKQVCAAVRKLVNGVGLTKKGETIATFMVNQSIGSLWQCDVKALRVAAELWVRYKMKPREDLSNGWRWHHHLNYIAKFQGTMPLPVQTVNKILRKRYERHPPSDSDEDEDDAPNLHAEHNDDADDATDATDNKEIHDRGHMQPSDDEDEDIDEPEEEEEDDEDDDEDDDNDDDDEEENAPPVIAPPVVASRKRRRKDEDEDPALWEEPSVVQQLGRTAALLPKLDRFLKAKGRAKHCGKAQWRAIRKWCRTTEGVNTLREAGLDPLSFHLHHIRPANRGGYSCIYNCAFAPGSANSSWGDNENEIMRSYVGHNACKISDHFHRWATHITSKGLDISSYNPTGATLM